MGGYRLDRGLRSVRFPRSVRFRTVRWNPRGSLPDTRGICHFFYCKNALQSVVYCSGEDHEFRFIRGTTRISWNDNVIHVY